MSYMCNITSFDLIERKFIFSSTTSMKKTKTTATQTTTWTLLQPLCHHGSLTANRLDDNATGYPPPPLARFYLYRWREISSFIFYEGMDADALVRRGTPETA